MRKTVALLAGATLFTCSSIAFSAQTKNEPTPADERTISAITNHFGFDSVKGIDFSKKSGELCLNAGLPTGGHMTHFSVDPSATVEDIIDFVRVDQLVAAGLDTAALPRHPGTLGSMKPGQWYFVPAGSFEPHHGTKFPFPLIVRATDVR